MAILVDRPRWHWRGRLWAHLVSDESLDELHAFAAELGIPRRPASRATTTTSPPSIELAPSPWAPAR